VTSKILINGKLVHESPKAVLFDKDGTLIDIHHYWASMIRIRADVIAQHLLIAVADEQEIKAALIDAMGVDSHSGRMKPDGPVGIKPRPFIVGVAADVVRKRGFDISNSEMEALFYEVDLATSEEMLPLLRLLPGIEALLRKLQECEIKSIIVSTDITSRARRAMEVLKLDHYFSEIIGGDLVENTKPAADLAELALAKVSCSASDAVVIGDHPVDILMGRNACIGLNIGVLTGLSDKDGFANHECHVIPNLQSIEVVCSDVN